jgi:hypothetical protein
MLSISNILQHLSCFISSMYSKILIIVVLDNKLCFFNKFYHFYSILHKGSDELLPSHCVLSSRSDPQCKMLTNLLFYKLLGLNSTKFGLNHPFHGYFQNCIWWCCQSSNMTAVTIYRTHWEVGLYIDPNGPIKQHFSTKWTEIWKVSPF